MPSLLDVRKNIQSTRNTKKITQAMQLVAASKMKVFQRKMKHTRAYATDLLSALHVTRHSLSETSFGSAPNMATGVLFVVLSSDKGLCGSLNPQLLRALQKSERFTSLAAEDRHVVTIGKKAYEAMQRLAVDIPAHFEGLSEAFDPLDALRVIDPIITYWESGQCREVILVGPRYVNAFTFEVARTPLLPFTEELLAEALPDIPSGGDVAVFEPGLSEVRERLGMQVVQSMILKAFYELKATEFSMRMSAMKKATDAADDRIKALTLQFNKARQSAITMQLAELASANEAMSSEESYEIRES